MAADGNVECNEEWWKEHLPNDITVETFTQEELRLFEVYKISQDFKRVFSIVTMHTRNMPTLTKDHPEEVIWCIGICSLDFGDKDRDMQRFVKSVEERVRKLEEAERRFQFLTKKWDKNIMRRLLLSWFEGGLVVDPALVTKDGRIMQWVHEYFAGSYPDKADQTEQWKDEGLQMYVLMVRSILRAYPAVSMRGIVSFSDMKEFDWEKYDMETKIRMGDLPSLIPHAKLCRMITFHLDERMKEQMELMGPSIRKKWGVVMYDNYKEAIEKETSLPDSIPTFVGGSYHVNVLECLKSLFSQEPDALNLMLEVYTDLKESGDLPCPPHMQL